MLRKLIAVLVLLLLGAGVMYYALGHHIVKTGDRTLIVPKTEAALADTYANITDWTADDFRRRPRLVEAGHGELIPRTILGDLSDSLREALERVLGDEESEP